MRKRIVILLVITGIIASIPAGCTPEDGPQLGGVLNQALVGNPSMLNPILSNDNASSTVSGYIYQGLVRYDENMQLVGQLAENWSISPDNLEWTFYLRQDVHWHDGQLFTAHDVEFTFATVAFDEDYPGSRVDEFTLLKQVEVIDDYTVKFTLTAPSASFMANLSLGILPRHIFDPNRAVGADSVPIADMAQHPGNWHPVGTGPYTFYTWVNDRYLILECNDNYYTDGPYIQTMRFTFFPDVQAAVSALEAGEVDLVTDIPYTDAGKLEASLAETHNFYSCQDMGYEFLGFNFRPSAFGTGQANPWLDRRTRQAVAYAINREECIQEVLQGKGVLMESPLPPASWAYSPEEVMQYAYDPAMASQLLNDAGWMQRTDGWLYKDGQKFTFQLTVRKDNALDMTLAEMIQANLGEIGIEVKINAVQWSEMLLDYVYAGNFHMVLMGLSLTADPDVYTIFHSSAAKDGLNFGAYSNSQLDTVLKMGRQVVDVEVRQELYAEAQRILTDDLPFVYLFSREMTTAARQGVHGLVSSPLGLCWPERWYIEEDK